jgi:hypothetical protein
MVFLNTAERFCAAIKLGADGEWAHQHTYEQESIIFGRQLANTFAESKGKSCLFLPLAFDPTTPGMHQLSASYSQNCGLLTQPNKLAH